MCSVPQCLDQKWTFEFDETFTIAARTSFVIAFDSETFLQYFGTEPDLAVELNEALNATGESTALSQGVETVDITLV